MQAAIDPVGISDEEIVAQARDRQRALAVIRRVRRVLGDLGLADLRLPPYVRSAPAPTGRDHEVDETIADLYAKRRARARARRAFARADG